MGVEKPGRSRNVRLGLRVGLGIATVYSAWVAFVRLALGPHAFDRFGLNWWQLVAIYYGGLSLGGWAYGLLVPLKRHLWGALLQGIVLILPMYGGVMLAVGLSVPRSEFRTYMIASLIVALIVGAALGFSWWTDEHDVAEDPADAGRR